MTEPDAPYHRDALERAILGAGPTLTNEQVAAASGIDLADARRLWRALGFPDAGEHPAFTPADLDALKTVMGAVDSGAVDFDTAVRLTRALGQTMARLADWEVATLVPLVERLEVSEEATGSRIGSALRLLESVGVPFEALMIYAWRRHLAAAVSRVEALGASDADLHTIRLAVGFADLVAFTALSNELDEDGIGDLVEIFESRCADVVAGHGGRVIKTLGDSVLFVADEPDRAMDIALAVVSVIGRDKRMPDVRIGLAWGSVVTRMGDVYGRPVNLAARLTAVARRNRVITDLDTAGRLSADRFDTQAMPPRPLRGFGVMQPVAVRLR